MNFNIQVTQVEKQKKASLILGILENGELTPKAKEIDELSQGFITKLKQTGSFNGKIGEVLPLFHVPHTNLEHVVLIGFGSAKTLSPMVFRKTIAAAIKLISTIGLKDAVCYLAELKIDHKSLAWKVKQIVEATWEGLYRFDLFRTQKDPAITLKDMIIHIPDASEQKVCEEAMRQGDAIAKGVILTKNLANLPSNICTPTFLAEQALDLAKNHPAISVQVLEEKDMKKLGMGALLAVSQGSAEDSKLICLEYSSDKTTKQQTPVALIGKGITFDTGGNSLKPADSMVGMKYDMCGAATVLGTMKAAALLKLPIHLIGVVAAVENMPGGTAYKPEDILTGMSGQTIEVISTDAEGRLILSDALTYCERYKPDVVIDIATLTGAVVIALGFHATGLIANNETLAKELLKAGEESNDRAWQLPLWDEYQEQIKSPFADMANTGGRTAGVITAGCFLSRFAKKFRWAHLDVAGTAAMMMGTAERAASGRPLPLLMQFLIDRSKEHAHS